MMNVKAIAATILDGVGGRGNVISLNYCATRLRFELNDYDKIDDGKVSQPEEVQATFVTAGQFQVVLISDVVETVYDALNDLLDDHVSEHASQLAEAILEGVGGKKNIATLGYCATRLRLALVDESQLDDAAVKAHSGIKATALTLGQYQIVLDVSTDSELIKGVYDQLAELVTDTGDERLKAAAKSILEGIGGKDNVATLGYCATRLRMELKDYDKVDDAKVAAVEQIKTTVMAVGQYQLVLDNAVDADIVKQMYDALAALLVPKSERVQPEEESNPLKRAVKVLLGKI